jgi:3-methyl-2-oxobutanoate hydroxymethyltransferase
MGFRVQARDEAAAERLIEEAKLLEAAGCFALVVECIPSALGAKVSAALSIPVIGIGAGAETDGQILVWQDLLGLNQNRLAKFVRRFANLGEAVQNALSDYASSVGNGSYPAPAEAYE